MGIKVGVGGVVRETGVQKVGVSGVVRTVTEGFCGVNGVVRRFLGAEVPPSSLVSYFTVDIQVFAFNGYGSEVSETFSATFSRYSDDYKTYKASATTPRFFDTRGYTSGKMKLGYIPNDITHGFQKIGTKRVHEQEFTYYTNTDEFYCAGIDLTGSDINLVYKTR